MGGGGGGGGWVYNRICLNLLRIEKISIKSNDKLLNRNLLTIYIYKNYLKSISNRDQTNENLKQKIIQFC